MVSRNRVFAILGEHHNIKASLWLRECIKQLRLRIYTLLHKISGQYKFAIGVTTFFWKVDFTFLIKEGVLWNGSGCKAFFGEVGFFRGWIFHTPGGGNDGGGPGCPWKIFYLPPYKLTKKVLTKKVNEVFYLHLDDLWLEQILFLLELWLHRLVLVILVVLFCVHLLEINLIVLWLFLWTNKSKRNHKLASNFKLLHNETLEFGHKFKLRAVNNDWYVRLFLPQKFRSLFLCILFCLHSFSKY